MFNNVTQNKKYVSCVFILYAASLCVSKFGISFFGAILAFLGLFYFLTAKDKNKDNYIIFVLYFLGIALQFLSLGGAKSALFFISKNYFLLILIFSLYFLEKYDIGGLLIRAVEIGLFIGILKSFYNFYTAFGFTFGGGIRVESFFAVMRWGIVLTMGLLLILPNLYKKDIFSWIVFVSGIFSLILSGSRGPMLAFVVGVLFYLSFAKKIKTILAVGILCSIAIAGSSFQVLHYLDQFSNRINSIVDSKNASNSSRFFMWRENTNMMLDAVSDNKKLFLFGTGIKNKEPIFENYITEKQSYRDLNDGIKSQISFEDAHNAYLNMLIRTGAIYTAIYYSVLIYLTLKIFKAYIKTENNEILACLAGMAAFYFCGVFYGYSFTYETFLFFFIIGLGLYKADRSRIPLKN